MQKIRFLIITLIVVCGVQRADAQFKNQIFSNPVFHHSVQSIQPHYRYRNPGAAVWMSLGSTFLPSIAGYIILNSTSINDSKTLRYFGGTLIGAGVLFGPSVGDFYAHNYLAGATGIGIRTLSSLLIVGGILASFGDGSGTGVAVAGAVGVLGLMVSTIYNWNSAYHSAEKYNNAHHLSMAPVYYPKQKTLGLALKVRL